MTFPVPKTVSRTLRPYLYLTLPEAENDREPDQPHGHLL